jgi:hypothetical protein
MHLLAEVHIIVYYDISILAFFIVCMYIFVISLPTKLQLYYLQYYYIFIYIIYGFVGFADNLLNRPTDGATVSVRKNASEKALLFVRLSVPFSLRVPKNYS